MIDGASSVTVKFSDGVDVHGDGRRQRHLDRPRGAEGRTRPRRSSTPLTLGDSSAVAVGDGVVAIGNPFGLDDTVTSGIVSAVDREISAPDNTPIEGAIQTDAAINHGNSGGPLFDLAGKVIGITSQIQSDSRRQRRRRLRDPVEHRQVDRRPADRDRQGRSIALLGVTIRPTPRTASTIATVETGSGADKAGLKAGDVITAVDGKTVTTAEELRAVIAAHAPGDKLSLTILRDGRDHDRHRDARIELHKDRPPKRKSRRAGGAFVHLTDRPIRACALHSCSARLRPTRAPCPAGSGMYDATRRAAQGASGRKACTLRKESAPAGYPAADAGARRDLVVDLSRVLAGPLVARRSAISART